MGKFRRSDFPEIAEFIVEEYTRRKNNRKDLEKQWDEIDRQLAMVPDVSHKQTKRGDQFVADPEKAWMPETELPLQAQSLEVLTADARRMQFPDAGPWFRAHAALTDDYLDRADLDAIITGDKNQVPTQLDQSAADKLSEGIINHWHRQYDFYANIDLINAEAFKYGKGLGRGRIVTKQILINKAKGIVRQTQKIPVLLPWSIRKTYLDDRVYSVMNQGYMIGPAHIFYSKQNIKDLKVAAKEGSNDPENEYGGWIPGNLKDVEGDSNGVVEVLEWEGDLVVPRKSTGDIYVPGAIVTMILNGKRPIFRFRLRKHNFSSYIEFPYHEEDMENPYSTSPLMKGWPIQKAAVDAMNRYLIVAALNGAPPVSWNPDDPRMSAQGGPVVKPFAKWAFTDPPEVHDIGDPQALFAAYQGFINQYYDVVGVNPPRLGAQTVSHTTAYAKEAEISRGTVRTVDYVRNTLKGPLTKWLDMAMVLGKDVMGSSTIFIDGYDGFVDISKKHIPDLVVFDVHGAGGPQEEQIKEQKKMAALQTALQMDQLGMAAGKQPVINLESSIEEVLRNGGWTDTSVFTNRDQPIEGPSGQAGMAVNPGETASAGAAIQALSGRSV